ncbi:hypothetical protein [Cohnella soli]|uniref:Uncharacterized protein n=1 Tax=Cohnella soli TaxID=425005 RepID=A0ABW0HM91_9BACL
MAKDMEIVHEIDVKVRIRVSNDRLQEAGISAKEFAENITLFERGFDIPSVVLSQSEEDPVACFSAAIISSEVISEPETYPAVIGEPLTPGVELIFVHTFFKPSVTAQAFIALQPGHVWTVQWREMSQTGVQTVEVWGEGCEWDELLVLFRKGVAQKLKMGFLITANAESGFAERKESDLEWTLAM